MWFFSFQEAREIRAKARAMNAEWDRLHSPEYMASQKAYLNLANVISRVLYDCTARGVPRPETFAIPQQDYDATAAYRARFNQPDLMVWGVKIVAVP